MEEQALLNSFMHKTLECNAFYVTFAISKMFCVNKFLDFTNFPSHAAEVFVRFVISTTNCCRVGPPWTLTWLGFIAYTRDTSRSPGVILYTQLFFTINFVTRGVCCLKQNTMLIIWSLFEVHECQMLSRVSIQKRKNKDHTSWLLSAGRHISFYNAY